MLTEIFLEGLKAMPATLKQLVTANPEAPPRGSVLPCETYESVKIDPNNMRNQFEAAAVARAKHHLLERATNFSTYHNSTMTLSWEQEGNVIKLKVKHERRE
jgi:hypothetical protein